MRYSTDELDEAEVTGGDGEGGTFLIRSRHFIANCIEPNWETNSNGVKKEVISDILDFIMRFISAGIEPKSTSTPRIFMKNRIST